MTESGPARTSANEKRKFAWIIDPEADELGERRLAISSWSDDWTSRCPAMGASR